MRSTKIVLLTLVGVAVVALMGIGVFLRHGFSARVAPSRAEARIARIARSVAMPREYKDMKNPSSQNDSADEAKRHYVNHCASCHAIDGSGNTAFGRNMYPRVPDLRADETQRLSDGELFYVIANGVRFTGMPAFGGEESPEEIWPLVPLLRRLKNLPQEELLVMGRMAMEPMGEHSEDGKKSPHMHDKPH